MPIVDRQPRGEFHRLRHLDCHNQGGSHAAAVFPPERHRAAAVVTFFTPGLRLFHEGQLEGRRVHASMPLGRRPEEALALVKQLEQRPAA